MDQGFTTRPRFDEALRAQEVAEAQLESAEAQADTARLRLGYTRLYADAPGPVTARSIEPGEAVAVVDFDLVPKFLLKRFARGLEAIVEGVGHGGELGVMVHRERAGYGARTAPAATNQAQLEGVAARGVCAAADIKRAGQGRAGEHTRLDQEGSSRLGKAR